MPARGGAPGGTRIFLEPAGRTFAPQARRCSNGSASARRCESSEPRWCAKPWCSRWRRGYFAEETIEGKVLNAKASFMLLGRLIITGRRRGHFSDHAKPL